LLLEGCATPIQKAGDLHQSAAEKWYALSQYTSSQLPLYGFTVTAKLGIMTKDDQPVLVLSEINMSPRADTFRLNLLVPNFDNKYICTPQCMQLVEYTTPKGEDANTLLTRYLTLYEFELFAFYGDMFVLNDALADLNKEGGQFLQEYLSYLSNKSADFNSLREFTYYLKEELSLKAYRKFVDDPQLRYKNSVDGFLSNQQTRHNDAIFKDQRPDELWSANLQDSPEALWSKGDLKEDLRQDWDIHNVLQDMLVMSQGQSTPLRWLEAKQEPLEVGMMVCGFDDNYFGIIKSMSLNQLEVFVQGQAKRSIDGTITNLVSGSLFHESAKVAFMPMTEKMSFLPTEVASCNVQ
jgi:hypothetical protein